MDISQLNESQRNLLSQFQSISSIEDGDLCLSILVACDWNLQSSLQQVGVMDEDFNSSGGLHHRGANAGDTPLNGGSSSMIEDDDDDGDDHNAGDTSPLLGGDSGTRNRNIRNTNNNSNFRQNNGNNINNNNNSNGNSSSEGILSFLNWMITIESVPMNADRDARKFHATFRSKYGLNSIEFFDGSYRRAVAAAFRSSKMLLVYLHSSLHDDAEKYVNDILGNEYNDIGSIKTILHHQTNNDEKVRAYIHAVESEINPLWNSEENEIESDDESDDDEADEADNDNNNSVESEESNNHNTNPNTITATNLAFLEMMSSGILQGIFGFGPNLNDDEDEEENEEKNGSSDSDQSEEEEEEEEPF